MSRLLAIDADLSAPPSSPSCFRDVSLQAAIHHYDTIAICPPDWVDSYDTWFASYGLWDYLDAILTPAEAEHEDITIHVQGGPNARLNVLNLHAVIRMLT